MVLASEIASQFVENTLSLLGNIVFPIRAAVCYLQQSNSLVVIESVEIKFIHHHTSCSVGFVETLTH